MNHALITGGAGFIGFHLASELVKKNCRVSLVDNFQRGVKDPELETLLKNPLIKLYPRDLLAHDSWNDLPQDIDTFFHFAAILGVSNVLSRPFDTLRKNTEMLFSALDFASSLKKLNRFVFTSTSEVYAGTLKHFSLPIPTPESTPLALTELNHPRTSYMLSKIFGESLCHYSGLPITLIRPHNIYGPRMGLSHVVPELLQKVHTLPLGGELIVNSVNHKRTFCYIDDAVELIIRCAHLKDSLGQALNVGTQAPEISIRELAEAVRRTVNKEVKIIAGETTAGSPARRCPDMTLTSHITGYQSKIGIDEGLKRTYAWYKQTIFDGQGVSAR